MTVLLITLHVVVCLAIIVIVLLQAGKGAEIGASFGAGGSQTVFGAGGSQSFMGKLTTGAAILFMLTSLSLAYFYGDAGSASVMPDTVAPTAQQAPVDIEPAAPIEPPVAPSGSDETQK